MSIFSLIAQGDPVLVAHALRENIYVVDERVDGDRRIEFSPYNDAIEQLASLKRGLKKEEDKTPQNLTKITKFRTIVNALPEIIVLLRDATLQVLIEREDIAGLNEMAAIEPFMGSKFKTGQHAGEFPHTYAETLGKTEVDLWYKARDAATDAYFSRPKSGTFFDGACGASDALRAAEAQRAAAQRAAASHTVEQLTALASNTRV